MRWLLPAILVVVWLGLGGSLGVLSGRLGEVADSGSAAYLPRDAEATQARAFGAPDSLPAIVVYPDASGIEGDRLAVSEELGDRLAGPVGELRLAGGAGYFLVQFAGTDVDKVADQIDRLRQIVGPHGAHVTGPAGVERDLGTAIAGIDLFLVLVTGGVILLILIVVYRSPLLPLLVLAIAGTALGTAMGVLYLLARAGVLTMGAEVQGIFSVLVLGAGTDYALLLVSRFREELAREPDPYAAMRTAWRGSFGAILASATTVAAALLCLLLSDLGLNRDLGPAGAIGIACALLAMLTLLPAALLLLGRAAFWPRYPQTTHLRSGHASSTLRQPSSTFRQPSSTPGELTSTLRVRVAGREPQDASRTRGYLEGGGVGRLWPWVAERVGRRPRALWVGAALVLAVMGLGVLRLDASGLPVSEQILGGPVDSARGQAVLAEHFPAGEGNPAIVVADAGRAGVVREAAGAVPGVAGAEVVSIVDGKAMVAVTLADAPDSRAARATVERIREAVHRVADAKVGGYTAVEVDFAAAAKRDRIVLPLLVLVVLVMLILLLRALIAPLLLVATVLLSYLAAIGVSAVVFRDLLGFAGEDVTYPVHAFVFLVALGVDYNIFLMTRVREESKRLGTRAGTLRALAVTGGVITSAGVVLAATFSALALIPLVLLVELAFTVAFGVLLDTLLVRSVLVPALTVDCGRLVWWPARGSVDEVPLALGEHGDPLRELAR